MRYAGGIAVRGLKRCCVGHRFRVENCQVRPHAWRNPSPVGQTQAGGGKPGHLAYGLSQRHNLLFPHVAGQEPGEGPVTPGVGLAGGKHALSADRVAVAAHRYPPSACDVLYVLLL